MKFIKSMRVKCMNHPGSVTTVIRMISTLQIYSLSATTDLLDTKAERFPKGPNELLTKTNASFLVIKAAETKVVVPLSLN